MATITSSKPRELYEFGPFRVDAEKELLLRDDEAVPLAPKAFQVLLVLIRHGKNVVSKDELMKSIWPDTFVEEANLSRNIFLLRKALGESPQDHQYIVTVPGRGYRFAEDVQLVADQELNDVSASRTEAPLEVSDGSRWRWIVLAAIVGAAAGVGAWLLFGHRKPVLSETDTILIADFANSTGDPVFNETLRQGLSVELEQSPFLSLIPDQRIQQTLRLMGQSPDARLTPAIAQDLCLRTQSAAYLSGSIASIGSQYVLGLKAVSCPKGDVLAEEQETAGSKEQVLPALDRAAGKLRAKLGESLKTVEKFDTPLEQATTPSLEALQAYSLGRNTQVGKDEFAKAVPFLERAVQLDPNFAMAWAVLASVYWNTGATIEGSECARRAYQLHAPVSEPEKFYIESTYYHYVLGDLDKARQVYDVWVRTYPRNSSAPIRLRQLDCQEGKYEEALAEIREADRLDPSKKGLTSQNTVETLVRLNRFDEASATARRAIAEGFGSNTLQFDLYELAFIENDPAAMAHIASSITGRAFNIPSILEDQAEVAAYSGRMKQFRSFSDQAIAEAKRGGREELATDFESFRVWQGAELARAAGEKAGIESPPTTNASDGAENAIAMAFALAGDSARAESMADDLARRYPADTIVQFHFLPTIRAQIALNSNDPQKAIELLEPALPYELSIQWSVPLGSAYVRGEAYLMAHRGNEAAAEFQKFMDHRGIISFNPIGAMALLQQARAYAMAGNKDKARTDYRQFLMLWKDADPDLAVLKQAKAEFARLQ